MAGSSYPFDDGPGSTITEDQWSFLMRDAVGNGVHEGLAGGSGPGLESLDLRVTSLEEPGTLHLRRGRATISGFHYYQATDDVIAFNANTDPNNDRIDAVSLVLDLTANEISVVVKQGTPASTPAAPALEGSHELRLAEFRVRRNANVVLSNEVTDRRSFIGRRVGFGSGMPNTAREGDITYVPQLESWLLYKADGGSTAISTAEDLATHRDSTNPHPNLLSASFFSITPDSLVGNIAVATRALNLPGGFKLVNLYWYAKFQGATDQSGYILGVIDDAPYRPPVTLRFPGQQFRGVNETAEYPFVARIDPDGTIRCSDTRLMGNAWFIFNAMYFVGPGL